MSRRRPLTERQPASPAPATRATLPIAVTFCPVHAGQNLTAVLAGQELRLVALVRQVSAAQLTQVLAAGRAASRLAGIGWPQHSQAP